MTRLIASGIGVMAAVLAIGVSPVAAQCIMYCNGPSEPPVKVDCSSPVCPSSSGGSSGRNERSRKSREEKNAEREEKRREDAERKAADERIKRFNKMMREDEAERSRVKAEEEGRQRAGNDAELKRQQDKQAQFLNDKAVLKSGLKVTPNAPGGGSYSGEAAAAPGAELKHTPAYTTFQGTQTAWKQLNCAAFISRSGIDALLQNQPPPYEQFRYLISEAGKAVSGSPVALTCPSAPAMPSAYGAQVTAKYKEKYLALLERTRQAGTQLESAWPRRRAQLDALIAAQARLVSAGGDAAAKAEHARLQRERESLSAPAGSRTFQPTAAAPPPPRQSDPVRDPRAPLPGDAMAQALAAAKAARDAYQQTVQAIDARQAELGHMKEIARQVESGAADAMDLLSQAIPEKKP